MSGLKLYGDCEFSEAVPTWYNILPAETRRASTPGTVQIRSENPPVQDLFHRQIMIMT